LFNRSAPGGPRMEGTGILDEIGKHWFGQFGDAIKVD
jgi:hypothetical protein